MILVLLLGISLSKSKSKNARREPILNKKDIKMFKMKSKSLEYNFLRSSPKLEGLTESCSKLELSRTDFPFVEEPKNIYKAKNKNYQISMAAEDEDNDLPVLIVFVIGGVAHNEITAMERLYQEKKINHRLVIGSTSIITANQFIDQLRDLQAPQDASDNNYLENKNIDMTDIELALKK